MAQQSDPWPDIEQAALAAFSTYVYTGDPALIPVIHRSARYAKVDRARREIVIDRRAVMLALIASGLAQAPADGVGAWVASWLGGKFRIDVPRMAELETPAQDLIAAFNDKLKVVTSQSLTTLLPRAVTIAERTCGRSSADLRHIVVAMLATSYAGWPEFADFGWTPSAADIAELRRLLHGRITWQPQEGENLEAWREILGADSAAETAPTARRPREIPVVNIAADRPDSETAGDPLRIEPDVKAFAHMICLDQAAMPLSIGLFGGWGSGKSTFMERLQKEVAETTRKERARREREHQKRPEAPAGEPPATPAPDAPSEPHFIGNVVQIRFNAWHFADANLWASLAAEFFDQLRSGGYARQGDVKLARLVEQVNAHVHLLSKTLAESRAALAEDERKVGEAQSAHDQAVQKAEIAPGTVLSERLVAAVSAAYEQHKADFAGAEQVAEVAKQAQDIAGWSVAIWRVATARNGRIALVGAAALLAAAPFVLPHLIATPAVTRWFAEIGGWPSIAAFMGAAAALAGAIAPAVRVVHSIVASTADFADEIKEVSAENLKDVVATEAELSAAREQAEARRQAVDREAKALARYVDPEEITNPPRLLRFVLEDDPDTKALEKEIGIISRARRLFEAVDQIVRKQRKDSGTGNGGDPDVPDRIVLYIDDLDRCTHAQVYAVLQAVHLLLAFELFVVVVGVDVNWVQEALKPEVASSQGMDQKEIERARQQRAIDYLEKIFQLPFWLQPLTVEGSDGGSYGRYVRTLLAGNVKTRVDGVSAPPAGTDAKTPAGAPAAGAGQARAAGAPPEHGRDGSTTTGPDDELREALDRVRLDDKEIKFLASPEIGRLTANPRAVKRLANVYRIIHSLMTESDPGALTGADGLPPRYPALLVLAAIEAGQPVEIVDDFYEGLLECQKDEALVGPPKPAGAAQAAAGAKATRARKRRIDDAFRKCPALLAALEAARAERGGPAVTAGECLELARTVRRYSFKRYHYH